MEGRVGVRSQTITARSVVATLAGSSAAVIVAGVALVWWSDPCDLPLGVECVAEQSGGAGAATASEARATPDATPQASDFAADTDLATAPLSPPPDPATETAAQVLAQTFGTLSAEQSEATSSLVQVVPPAAEGGAGAPLVSRTVKTVPVGVDGRPIILSARAVAARPTGTATPAIPPSSGRADGTDVAVRAGTPDIDPLDTAPAVTAPIPLTRPAGLGAEGAGGGDVRTVGGSGVTVRSGPSRSEGSLFALAAGETVTVLDEQRGWLKIVDGEGRGGWLYEDLVR